MLKWVKQMFYVPKYGKVTDKVLISRLTMHISIIIVCLISMSLSAFAYFSSSVTSGTNVIRAAYFDVEISIEKTQQEVNGTQTINAEKTTLQKSGNQYTAELEADEYTVTINKVGTAKTGFVVVKIGDTVYHTEQLDENKKTIAFTLELNTAREVTFIPNWGTSSNYSQVSSIQEIDEYIADGETVNAATMILDPAPAGTTEQSGSAEQTDATEATDAATDPSEDAEIVYIVQKDDNLTEIAEAYGTTVERLQVYNNIEDANYIEIGWKIKIPPEDWVIPEATESEETEPADPTEPLE